MNTQETLEGLVKKFEDQIKIQGTANKELIIAYCLAVIARSMTR